MAGERKLFKIIGIFLISVISFIYIFSFFLTPSADWDPMFYPLIGKGIFEYHILPYDYIFDHKPYLVYVFYYIWCRIEFILNGRFTILAFSSMILICVLFNKFYKTRFFPTVFYVFFGGVIGAYFSGNTEVIQTPIILFSIILLTKGIERKNYYYFLISGILAAIVVNVNYLSGCILAPIFLYVMFSRMCTFYEFLTIIAGGVLSLTLIFLPFLIAGHGKLLAYFSMQHHFLEHYSANLGERLYTVQIVLAKISFLYPALLLWFKDKAVFWDNMRGRIITLWFLFSVLAAIMSGHAYDHYSSLFIIPAMAMCAILQKNGRLPSFWLMTPLYIYSAIYMITTTIDNVNNIKSIKRENPLAVSQIVGKRKVLNIRSDNSLYYLANLETFDPFLFIDHIDVYFGTQADEHYMQDLRQKPDFVLMPYQSCTANDINHIEDNICAWIKDNYHMVYKAYNHKHPLRVTSRYYQLYEINNK